MIYNGPRMTFEGVPQPVKRVKPSLLRKIPLLRAMSATQFRRLSEIVRLQEAPAGSRIFGKTDLARHMFIVASGRVKIYCSSGRRKRKTFAYLRRGDFFGEMGLLNSRERSESAESVEDSTLLFLRKRDFKRFLLADSKLCYFMLRTLSSRLREANEQIENLLFKNVLGRVSKTLVDLARYDGRRFRGGLMIQGPYTRRELAELIGTTREPLSRALATLQRAQLVRFHHDRIVLVDPGRMEALLGAQPAEAAR